jgi:DNA-binding response OmpR family regulator
MSRDRIVIVDDDPGIRRLLDDALSRLGYHVLATTSGRATLRRLEEHDPHLVLLDIATAGRDGLDTLDQIRAERPAVPVVIVTAYADVATAARALAHGAADYVTKPLDLGYLEQVVAVHLREQGNQPPLMTPPARTAVRRVLRSIPGRRR